MRITVLMENTAGQSGAAAEHGLSLFVRTDNHSLLMDTGASDLTWDNAEIVGADLSDVDTVVLSHGHYDHTGGLVTFARSHPRAKIYIRDNAFEPFYHGEKYIGTDPRARELPNLVRVKKEYLEPDEELVLFSGIRGRRLWPEGNRELTRKTEAGFVQDDFSHEQCLVIRTPEGGVLLSGCAHNGILNILDRYHELFGMWPRAVISGFHMMKKAEWTDADDLAAEETARELVRLPGVFYTGHCTGQEAFARMKPILGDRLIPLHSGDEILL